MSLIERFFTKKRPVNKGQEITPEEWKDIDDSLSESAKRIELDTDWEAVEKFTRQATSFSTEKLGRRIGKSPGVMPKNEFGKSSIYSFGELSTK